MDLLVAVERVAETWSRNNRANRKEQEEIFCVLPKPAAKQKMPRKRKESMGREFRSARTESQRSETAGGKRQSKGEKLHCRVDGGRELWRQRCLHHDKYAKSDNRAKQVGEVGGRPFKYRRRQE